VELSAAAGDGARWTATQELDQRPPVANAYSITTKFDAAYGAEFLKRIQSVPASVSNISSEAACAAHCSATANCTQWVWNYGSAPRIFYCYTSSGRVWGGGGNDHITSGCTAGLVEGCGGAYSITTKFDAAHGAEFLKHIQSVPTSVSNISSEAACAAHCAATANCTQWVWNYGSGPRSHGR
jgi:hypothetical protein